MTGIRGVGIAVVAVALVALALSPTALTVVFDAAGMNPQAARIAGSRMAVLVAFVGTGVLIMGLTGLSRRARIRRCSLAMADALAALPGSSNPTVAVLEKGGAVLSAEFDGLRMEVVVEPLMGGSAWVRTRAPAKQNVTFWPRGLTMEEAGVVVATGQFYECVSAHDNPALRELDSVLNAVFGEGGASRVTHNRTGIEVCLPGGPAEGRSARLRDAISLVAGLARINR